MKIIGRYITFIVLTISTIFCFTKISIFAKENKISFNTIKEKQKISLLVKENSIQAFIKADHNNFGIISIHFNSTSHQDLDVIIVDQTENKTISRSVVDSFALGKIKYYPFGFPIQKESKNHNYLLEIKSRDGQKITNTIDNSDEKIGFGMYKLNLEKNESFKNILETIYLRIISLRNEDLLLRETLHQILYACFIVVLFFLIKENRKRLKKSGILREISFSITPPQLLFVVLFLINIQYLNGTVSTIFSAINAIIILILLLFNKSGEKVLNICMISCLILFILNLLLENYKICEGYTSWIYILIFPKLFLLQFSSFKRN